MNLALAPNLLTTRPGASVHVQRGAEHCGVPAISVTLVKTVMGSYANTGCVIATATHVASFMDRLMAMTMMMMGHGAPKMVVTVIMAMTMMMMGHGAPKMVVTVIMTMTMMMEQT